MSARPVSSPPNIHQVSPSSRFTPLRASSPLPRFRRVRRSRRSRLAQALRKLPEEVRVSACGRGVGVHRRDERRGPPFTAQLNGALLRAPPYLDLHSDGATALLASFHTLPQANGSR